MKLLTTLLSIFLLTSITTNSATINVPADQPTIQAGIDAAVDGDTVLLTELLYSGPGNRDIVINKKGITLLGASSLGMSTISCGGTAENPARAFEIGSIPDSTTVISNIRIQGGFGKLRFPYDGPTGGAILNLGGSPDFVDCEFAFCSAEFGSVLAEFGGNPRFKECVFTNTLRRRRFVFIVYGFIGRSLLHYSQ